jgi:LysR family transcriptional regulator, glycine cleavage system transcriptional activator
MVDRGPPFSALRALEAASRTKSYSLAGDELGVTHSAVSQAVRRLEREYGRTLFRRDGAQMAPSPAALSLAQAYREATRTVLRAAEDLKAGEGEGSLVLSTLPSIAKLWLGPKLRRLRDALPEITIEVRTTRDLANLHSDGVDVALRVGTGHWRDLRAELLFEEYVFPVCSPEFLERHGQPRGMDACVPAGPLILEDVNLWPLWFEAAGLKTPQPLRGPTYDDSALTVEAAAAGLGVALVRQLHAHEALAAGRLVRMSPVRVKDPFSCYLVWRPDSPRIAAIRRFADWVLAECDRAGLLEAA